MIVVIRALHPSSERSRLLTSDGEITFYLRFSFAFTIETLVFSRFLWGIALLRIEQSKSEVKNGVKAMFKLVIKTGKMCDVGLHW